MSSKRYIQNCEFCGRVYVAKSLKSRFDTDECRGAFNRMRKKNLVPKSMARNTYTLQDIWILMGKLCKAGQNDGPPLLGVLSQNHLTDQIIADFETRFSCLFIEVIEKHPQIAPGKDREQCQAIAEHYEGMGYSI